MLRLNPLFVVLPLTAILGGCGPEDLMDESEQGHEVPGAELRTVTQELPSNGVYSWSAPNSATPMGTTSGRFCFFNTLQGRFDTSSDSVHVFAAGGSWYLGGGGDTRAVSRCATRPSDSILSTEYRWTAGQQLATEMETATGRVCFLTGVSGDFDGSSDWVRVYVSGGYWYLQGSLSKQSGGARARCITVPSYSAEYSWSQTQSYDTHMGTTSNRVCALTYMGGQFDSLNEYIGIYAAAGSWYLGGASLHSGVAAKARCF